MKSAVTRKRIISIFLAVITVAGMVSPCFAAFADDGVIGFYDVEIFYEDGTLVPSNQEDGETEYIEYMHEGDKKQFTYQLIDCELPDNGYVKWTSDTPTVCDVTPEGVVRAFDSSKGAAVRLWLDNEVGTIPLVGGVMKSILEKALFNDNVNIDTMDTDAIIGIVEDAFGSDSVLGKYVDSYKGELIDSLRTYLDKVNTVISCTLYGADGEELDTDSFKVCVQKSEEPWADFIPNGTHITNKQDLPTTVAKGSTLQLTACTTPTRLHMGVIYSVKSTSIFTDGKVIATVDDSGLVTFKNTGTVTILVSPDTDGFIENLLKYINYIYDIGGTGTIDTGQIADILIKYVGLDMNRNALMAILDTCFAIKDIVGDTANPVQLTATAVKIIANIILQFTTNDSITFTVVDGVPLTDFDITGANTVKEGSQIQLAIENTQPVAADTSDITWTSSDPSIASVDPETGIITGRDAGASSFLEYSQQTVQITATSAANNVSKTVTITVTSKTGRYLSDVELTADKEVINIGEDQYIHAAVYPARVAEADNLYIRWGVEIWNAELDAVEYLWATDPYQETDEEGNLLFDENGDPVMNDGSVTDGIGRIDTLGHYYADAGGTCTIVCKAETGYYIGDGDFYQISEIIKAKDIDNGQPVEDISLSAIGSTGGSTLNVSTVEINGETLKYANVQIKAGDANVTYVNQGAKIKADITPENATNKKLHWYIDNNSFEIKNQDDSAGTVEVKLSAGNEKAQSVNIYCVSDDGEIRSDTITLCVARNYATDNKILGDELSVINGKTLEVSHEITFGGSLTGDNSACKNANWYSSDEDVLEISSVDSETGNAVVHGVDVGVVTLYCVSTDGGIVDSKEVTVYPDKSRLSEIIHLCEKTVIHKTDENAADYKTYMKVLNYAYYILEDEPLASQPTVDTYANELLYIFYKLGGYIGLNSITLLDKDGNEADDYISVNVSSLNYTNTSYKLGYILNPLGGMYSSIEWTSSNASAVSVDKYGKCTPASNDAGYATITVTATDYMGTSVTDSVVIAFGKTSVTGVTIEPASIDGGKAGETQQLEAVVEPLNTFGSSKADVSDVVWETSDKDVATVDENGLVTFVYGGDCVITATSVDGGYVGKCAVHVITNYTALQELVNTYTSLSLSPENYYPESYEAYLAKLAEAQQMIAANKSSQNEVNQMCSELEAAYKGLKKYTYIQRVELYLDGEATSDFYQYDLSLFKEGINYTRARLDLNVRLYPNNASYSSVRWESSTDKIIVDESGMATPAENETCYGRITCTVTDHFGNEYSDDVWVSFAFYPVTGVSLNQTEITGSLGEQQQLTCTVSPTGDSLTHIGQASIKDVYWESDNEDVAMVDQNGLVTFTGAGATIIRVVSYDGGHSAECKVSTEGDRTALNAALAKYADVDYMDYEYSYGMNFKKAYENAQAAVSDKSLTQSEIDSAAIMLNSAGSLLAGHEFKKAETISIDYDNQYHSLGVKWNSRGTGTIDSAAEFYTYKGESSTYNSRVILNAYIPAEAASNYSDVSWSVVSKSDNTSISIEGSSITINATSASRSAKTVLQLSATDTYGRVLTRTIRVVVAYSIVTGISIDKTDVSQYANAGTFQLNATVTPSDANVTEVLWSSSDESVAVVDENGVVTPKNSGSCVITAETFDGGYKASCNVTLSTDYSRLAARYAELMDFYTETKDTHTYTNSSLAVLEQTLIQANKIINESVASQADVELTISKLNEAYDNLVLFIPVEGVSISLVSGDNVSSPNDGFIRYAAASINGASLKLSAEVLPETVEGVEIKWSSSSSSITVDEDGTVKKTDASSEYAVITATATDENGNTAEKKVYVSFVRTAATGVSFSDELVFGAPTTTAALSPKVSSALTLAPASITDCLYSSANPEIASVDENGVVTFISSGETIITATTIDGGYTATIRAITTNDTTALAAAVEKYKSINYMDYEYEYGMEFKAAYENAVAVCDDYTATQEEIDNALVRLQTAYNNLTNHPFIAAGDVAIYAEDIRVENDNSYVKNADNQLVLTGKYADGAMIKSAEFTFENENNVTAEIINGRLVITKANDEEYGSIDVTYTVIDEYDRVTAVTKSIKIIDRQTLIESFRFVYNGEEVESVSAKSLTLSTLNVQLSINTYPEAAEAYTNIEWSSSNTKLTVDQNGLVKLSGTATATNYTATITCKITLSDGTVITNSIPVTFTRGI